MKIISLRENMNIKMANKIDEELPNGEQMSLYVLTLKQYAKDNPDISEEWRELIRQLPSPRKVSMDLSFQELRVLFETVEYLWKLITKSPIIPEEKIIKAPESLSGNYLMVANGILLKGINTHDIISRNSQLICTLLDISGMALQEYLSRHPNDLIKFIIKSGALRLLITKDKVLYAQCSPLVYGKWAKNKIRKLDFQKKIVKIIDMKSTFNGWKSGIVILL